MLEIQSYLQNNTIEQLKEELGIKTSRHTRYPNLVLFKYDQIKSPTYHPIVRECRGIILDENNNWRIVSYPFNRFYNYGQEEELNWSTAVVQEKLDGSCLQLYHYAGEWLVATSGTADASGQVNGYGFSFEHLFWKTFNKLEYRLPVNKKFTYIFELCTIYNKVVVDYKESRLVLLSCRCLLNQKEYKFVDHNWEVVKNYPLTTIEDLKNNLKITKGNEVEGYVIVDKTFNRIKIKSEAYVRLHHIKSNINTPNNLLEIIRKNETEELLIYFKEFQKEINQLHNKYYKLIVLINSTWEEHKHISNKKEFALTIKHLFYSDCLFSLYLNKIESVEDYLLNLDIKRLYEWISQQLY